VCVCVCVCEREREREMLKIVGRARNDHLHVYVENYLPEKGLSALSALSANKHTNLFDSNIHGKNN
jgi:hypothetical protein